MGKLDKINTDKFINSSSTVSNKEIVDFSFMEAKSIKEIEAGIKNAVQMSSKVQLSICISLYRIASEGLYAEYGYESFNQYVKNQALMPSSTATEYYYIGKNWLENKEDLKKIGFTEEDGLTKLKVFPKKFDKKDKALILEHLKKDSARQFKQFVSSLNSKGDLLARSRKEKKDIDFNQEYLVATAIDFIKIKEKFLDKKQVETIKYFIEYLADIGAVDKKYYNAMIYDLESK